jgi:hypothetical protein
MKENVAVVVTSIAKPNWILETLARGCQAKDYQFIVIGDLTSPSDFQLEGCRFYNVQEQLQTAFKLAPLTPTKHYARKNLGYLIAIKEGASLIIETDDDNIPEENFWLERARHLSLPTIANNGWLNVYRYFSEANIWPRGLPLERLKDEAPAFASLTVQDVDCPIQQGLCNEDPDTDAIYRLTSQLPQSFRNDRRLALTSGSWCPFNSQNTAWWRDAFPLLYLPAYCTFRMTDIWRSFVAQRIAWTNDWGILFHEPNARQERNDHNLLRDFKDEVPGYLNNAAICDALAKLPLRSGVEYIGENLLACYETLVSMALIDRQELRLVEAWLADLSEVQERRI